MDAENGLPRVTFFLLAYNQERYIVEACRAALAQTYSPLEIIFSDDCSTDRTFELIEETVKEYRGSHKIRFNRNQKNVGLIGHVNQSFELAATDLIVVGAGDDISSPNRVKRLVDAYLQTGKQALVLHSSVIKIDETNAELGVWTPPVIAKPMSLCELAKCQALYIGATAAWSRSLYEQFGPITFQDAYEDLVLGFRAALKNSLFYLDEPLVRYRVGVGLSAKPAPPVWKLSDRVKFRKQKLKIALDVHEQRLRDLDCVPETEAYEDVRIILLSLIKLQNKRLMFYGKLFDLLFGAFSRDFIIVLRSFNSEIKYLVGLGATARWVAAKVMKVARVSANQHS